jgi:hypothetical protein
MPAVKRGSHSNNYMVDRKDGTVGVTLILPNETAGSKGHYQTELREPSRGWHDKIRRWCSEIFGRFLFLIGSCALFLLVET